MGESMDSINQLLLVSLFISLPRERPQNHIWVIMKMKKVKNLDSQGIRDATVRMMVEEDDDSTGESSSDEGYFT